MSFNVGDTIGDYEVLGILGRGGMGAVYRVRNVLSQREEAMKVVLPYIDSDPAAAERFLREIRVQASLRHVNIAELRTAVRAGEHILMILELIDGESVSAKLKNGPLPFDLTFRIVDEMLNALGYAHQHGVVHRDVKPANIMVTNRGLSKLTDFGIARAASESPITQTNVAIGSVHYMSPEQIHSYTCDERSDLYSLGVTFYEMLTGRLPVNGQTAYEIMHAHTAIVPPPPDTLNPNLSPAISDVVMRSLAKSPEDRFPSAEAFRTALGEALFSTGLRASRYVPAEPAGPSGSDRRPEHGTDPRHIAPTVTTARPAGLPPSSPTAERVPAGSVATGAVSPAHSAAGSFIGGLRRRRLAWAAAAGALILAAAGIVLMTRGGPLDSIAVLPFVNSQADPSTDYLSDGIAEGVINQLSQLPGLSVRAFNSVAHYKGKDTSAGTAGRELNVRAVLTGRVVRQGSEVTVSAELVDVRGDRQIWGSQYTQKAADLPAVQQQISQEVSATLGLRLSSQDKQRLNKQPTGDAVAYQLYLQGRYQWNRRTLEGLQQAIDYFNQAIEKDPRYALAYAGKADAYALMTDFNVLPAREIIPRLQAAAAKAIDLDNSLAEAHTSLAWAAFHQWDWGGAEKEFKRALELNPSYATAHLWYGDYLLALGRFDEALPELNRAMEQNSLSPETNLALSYRLYYARQYPQAEAQSQKVLAMDSTFVPAHVLLGRTYAQQGKLADATDEFRKALDLSQGDSSELAGLGYAYALSHQTVEARKELDELMKRSEDTYVQPVWLAVIEIALGEKDAAFQWLEKSYADRSAWLVNLKVDPVFDGVRSDPRFSDLLRRVGLN